MKEESTNQKFVMLAVDDEQFNLALLAGIFDDTEFEVVRARNGMEALKKLQELKKCDVILLDRMMPKIDGMVVLRTLKADPRYRSIPVIMQTAVGEPKQIEEAMAAGACGYVVKPYDEDVIWSAVRNALIIGRGGASERSATET